MDGRSIAAFPIQGADGDEEVVTFKLPKPSSGTLSAGEDGVVTCANNHGIGRLLELAKSLSPDSFASGQIGAGEEIVVPWDDALMAKMGQFMEVARGDMLLATHLLRSMMGIEGEALAQHLKMPDGSSVNEFLRGIECKVSIPLAPATERDINAALAGPFGDFVKQQRLEEFRKDFGIHSLLSLANQKDLNGSIAVGAAMSIVGTTAIGAAAEYGYVPALEGAVDRNMGSGKAAVLKPIIRSFGEPPPAEAWDSNVNKRLFVAMQGGNFIPTADEAKEDAIESGASGVIAGVGSLPNNYMRFAVEQLRDAKRPGAANGVSGLQQITTNVLNNWMSGVIVSYSIMKSRDKLAATLARMENSGKLPKLYNSSQERREAANNTIRAARGTGTSIRAHMMSAEIAMVGGSALAIAEATGLLSPELVQMGILMYSSPTEVESLIGESMAEMGVGDETGDPKDRITTDYGKQNRSLGQVASTSRTTPKDMDAIARPPGEWNAALGWPVANTIGSSMILGEKGIKKAADYSSQIMDAMSTAAGSYFDPETNRLSRSVVDNAGFVNQRALKPIGDNVMKPMGRAAMDNLVTPANTFVLKPVRGAALTHVLKPTANATVDWILKPALNGAQLLGKGAAVVGKAVHEYGLKPTYDHVVEPVGRNAVKPAATFTANQIDRFAWRPVQAGATRVGEIVSGRRREGGRETAEDQPQS